jgi:DNA primase
MVSANRFSRQIIPLLRARVSLSDVVRRRVVLTKSGREWKGLSPFQREKTPSFFVNDEKGTWFDFSSGKGGDVFSFLMETEGLSFREALEFLADKAGISLDDYKDDQKKGAGTESELLKLREVLEAATVFFEHQLIQSKGQDALAYVRRRGILQETQHTFRLGYAPQEGDSLCRALVQKGADIKTLQAAGLIVNDSRSSKFYDRFRHRLMFPIMDNHGRVIAFGGRALRSDVQAKYLNSPETPLFHKSQILYNAHRARAQRSQELLVVEGYFDVLSLHQAGLPHIVAPLGTAMTAEHMIQLWRWVSEPILCFDGDSAGQRAAERVIDVVLPFLSPGHSLRFAHFPSGQDPDEYVRLVGKSGVENLVAQSRPLVDVLWAREQKRELLETPEQKADFESRIRTCIAQIADKRVASYYKTECELRLKEMNIRRPAPQRSRSSFSSKALTHSSLFQKSAIVGTPREALILMALIVHPKFISLFDEALGEFNFSTVELQSLSAWLLKEASVSELINIDLCEKIKTHYPSLIERLQALVSLGDRWILSIDASHERVQLALEQAFVLQTRAQKLSEALKEAEKALAEEWNEVNLSIMRDLRMQYESVLVGACADDKK